MNARTTPVPRLRPPAPLSSGTVAAGVLTVLLGVLLAVLPAGPALAHTELAASTPADGAEAPTDLTEVVLSFTGEVRSELSTVVVTGPDGAAAAEGPVTVRGTDVVQAVRSPLAAGAWTVAYRVVASDGHPVSGTVDFSVAEAPAGGQGASSAGPSSSAPPTAAPQPSPSPTTDVELSAASEEQGGSLLVPALAVTALAVAAGAVLLRRRAGRSGSA